MKYIALLLLAAGMCLGCFGGCAATGDPYRQPDPMYQQSKDLCNNILDPQARQQCLRQAETDKYN